MTVCQCRAYTVSRNGRMTVNVLGCFWLEIAVSYSQGVFRNPQIFLSGHLIS